MVEQATTMMLPLEDDKKDNEIYKRIVNNMYLEIIEYVFSHPAPSGLDAEIDVRDMCQNQLEIFE